MRFPAHTPETATGKAADLLGDIVGRAGSAGAMVRTMAGSPSVLGGYLVTGLEPETLAATA